MLCCGLTLLPPLKRGLSRASGAVAERMTRDQLAEAQRLARELDAAHPREP